MISSAYPNPSLTYMVLTVWACEYAVSELKKFDFIAKGKMKVAHLILVHAQPQQLARLINSLQHPEADFYIHLDKKTDISPFQVGLLHEGLS